MPIEHTSGSQQCRYGDLDEPRIVVRLSADGSMQHFLLPWDGSQFIFGCLQSQRWLVFPLLFLMACVSVFVDWAWPWVSHIVSKPRTLCEVLPLDLGLLTVIIIVISISPRSVIYTALKSTKVYQFPGTHPDPPVCRP